MHRLSGATCFLLGLVLALSTADAHSRTRPLASLPRNAATVSHQGQEYAVGEIYLTAHADTALLVPFGFRGFEFHGWSLARACYLAEWPVSVALDALPDQLQNVEYATYDPQRDAELAELLEAGRNGSYRLRNRMFSASGREYYGGCLYDSENPSFSYMRRMNSASSDDFGPPDRPIGVSGRRHCGYTPSAITSGDPSQGRVICTPSGQTTLRTTPIQDMYLSNSPCRSNSYNSCGGYVRHGNRESYGGYHEYPRRRH